MAGFAPWNVYFFTSGGGRVERRCWVNFQCRGVLLVWLIVGQGPTALAVGAGGGGLDIFSLSYLFSILSPSLWETARFRLKYCLKGPLNPKQPTKSSPVTPIYDQDRLTFGARDNVKYCGHSEMFLLFLNETILCDPSFRTLLVH